MDSWINDQETIEELANELMHKLNQRNQYSIVTQPFAKSDLHIKDLYKKFQQKVSKLEANLAIISSSSKITQRETDRRQRMVDMLKSRSSQINNMIQNPESDRRTLFGNTPHTTYGSSQRDSYNESPVVGWNEMDAEAGPSSVESNGQSVSQLRQTQRVLLDEQDRGLDTLSTIIQRQKYIAQGINTEIDLHNEILDDISEAMLETDERLTRNTRNIRRVDRKTSTCGYWVLIILLFVAILVTTFVPV